MPARPQRVVERAHGEQGRLVHRARPLSSSSAGLSRGEMAPRCSVVAWRQGGPHVTFSFLLLLLNEFYEFPVEPGTGSRLGLIASACLRVRAAVEREHRSALIQAHRSGDGGRASRTMFFSSLYSDFQRLAAERAGWSVRVPSFKSAAGRLSCGRVG